jgi:ABC-2 type transport system permease protein
VIGAIIGKELIECRRDRRALVVAGLLALLVALGLITGWSTQAEQRRQARQAQRDDRAAFVQQGEKPPHAAAHFGRMAYRPAPPLAVFDPGATPYLGQVIWLEAHTRNPAMFRPAEDAPELRRLSDLSVAGVLTLVVPLLVFVIGCGSFAAERERGTLPQLMSTGAGLDRLFAGKLAVVAGVGVAVPLVAIAVSVALASSAHGAAAGDVLVRGAGLVVGYGCYGIACAAIAVLVSASVRSTRSALLVLLSVWAASVIIAPRIAASIAERAYPTPDSTAFWAGAANTLRAQRPARDSDDYRAAEREVLRRALGREVTAQEARALALDRVGLSMEVSELLGARAYATAYEDLYAIYEHQRSVRRWLSVLCPALALQQLSSALAGTDVAAHDHFAREAERQRNLVIRSINEDIILRGAGRGFAHLADDDLWTRVPEFDYRPPPASFAFRSARWELLVVMTWSAAALLVARRIARRQQVL